MENVNVRQQELQSVVAHDCILDFELKMLRLMSEDGDFFVSLYKVIDGNRLSEPFCRRAYCVLRDTYERNGEPMTGGIPALREKMIVMGKLVSELNYGDEEECALEYLTYMENLVITPKQAVEIKKDAKYLHAYTYTLDARRMFVMNSSKPISDIDFKQWKWSVEGYLDCAKRVKKIYDELVRLENIDKGNTTNKQGVGLKDNW